MAVGVSVAAVVGGPVGRLLGYLLLLVLAWLVLDSGSSEGMAPVRQTGIVHDCPVRTTPGSADAPGPADVHRDHRADATPCAEAPAR